MRIPRLFIIQLFFSKLLIAAPETYVLEAEPNGVYLGHYLEICPGSDRDDTHCFQKDAEIPDVKLGEGHFRFRLHVLNPGSQPQAVILENNYPSDFVRIQHLTAQGVQSDTSFGNDVYLRPAIMHRYAAQRLVFQPGEQDILIELRHTGSVRLPLRIWSEEKFQNNKYFEDVTAGILLGVTLAMMLYNIFLLLTFRFKQQIYYVGFLIATLLYLLFWSGFSQIVPGPWRLLLSKPWCSAASLMAVFLCHFTLQFLELRGSSRWLTRAFLFFAWSYGAAAILGIFHRESSFILFTLLLSPYMLVCMAAGCHGVWKRGRPSIFYLLSFTLVLAGGTLENLIAIGVVDPKWSFWPFFAASNLQSILLSLALGDKLHLDQKRAHGKIVDLNSELQKHVQHVNELVNEKTREIRSMMTNLPQGILMIQRDLTIHGDYSAYSHQLFERTTLENQPALDVIFQGTQIGPDRLAQLHAALQSCMGETDLAFQLNQACFPLECRRQTKQGTAQIMEMDWHPILNAESRIESFLVSVRDVTNLRKLQVQSAEQIQRLELIGEIINVDHAAFLRFMKSCRAFQGENRRLINKLMSYDPEVNKILFINLHTMKGVARGLHLAQLSDLFHRIEQHLADLQLSRVSYAQDVLLGYVEDITRQLDVYESVCSKDLGRSMHMDDHAILPMKDLEPFVLRIDQLDLSNTNDTRVFVADVRTLFTHLYYQDPMRIFTEIFSSLTRLSKDLAKEVPTVNFHLADVMVTREADDLFRNIFVHLLRNSMDHGIESAAERLKKNKTGKGMIELSLRPGGNGLEITYQDDGRGLDLQAIQAAARRQGLLGKDAKPDVKQLVNFIFASGFTTSHTLSDISGRGVGMDAVSRYIVEHGGTIQLQIPPTANLSWTHVPCSFLIVLPSRFYRTTESAA